MPQFGEQTKSWTAGFRTHDDCSWRYNVMNKKDRQQRSPFNHRIE